MKRGSGLRRLTPLRRSPLERQPAKPRAVPPRPAQVRPVEYRRADWQSVAGRCVMCGNPQTVRHHIVEQQTLKVEGLAHLLNCPDNALTICAQCHSSHHAWRRRIPRSALPLAALEFAERNGLGWWIDRFYPPAQERDAA
jgi:5-methylcytosine-specific restriction endonuclease McrA